MTRTVDAIPIDARGDHRPADSCPCVPIEGSDLLEPGIRIRIHRHMPDHPDPPPASADAMLWRSRERRRDPSKPW